jgi:hypothetical protein
MTALEALAILEAATLECKKRGVDMPQLRAALDFLEPHIYPRWLISQFRHNLDGEEHYERRSTASISHHFSRYPRLCSGTSACANGCSSA